jgi:hypothetical protein
MLKDFAFFTNLFCSLQGILDSRFDEILDLPRENPQFVIDLVTKFCSDAENSIAALIRYPYFPNNLHTFLLVKHYYFSIF